MGAVGEKTVKGIMNKYGVRELYDLLVSHYITALSVNMRPILRQITFNKKGTDFFFCVQGFMYSIRTLLSPSDYLNKNCTVAGM